MWTAGARSRVASPPSRGTNDRRRDPRPETRGSRAPRPAAHRRRAALHDQRRISRERDACVALRLERAGPVGARPLLARPREREPLARARRVHRLERVAHETLRAAERARHVEPAVEAPEILRGLEGLLERGLCEAESGGEP